MTSARRSRGRAAGAGGGIAEGCGSGSALRRRLGRPAGAAAARHAAGGCDPLCSASVALPTLQTAARLQHASPRMRPSASIGCLGMTECGSAGRQPAAACTSIIRPARPSRSGNTSSTTQRAPHRRSQSQIILGLSRGLREHHAVADGHPHAGAAPVDQLRSRRPQPGPGPQGPAPGWHRRWR